jgi:hypothetical protein
LVFAETTTAVSTILAALSLGALFLVALASDISDLNMKLRRNKVTKSEGQKEKKQTNKSDQLRKRNKKTNKLRTVMKKGTTLIRVQPK